MIVATTSTDDAGYYVINKAVLDRLIEGIVIRLTLESRGRHQLKGVEREQELFVARGT